IHSDNMLVESAASLATAGLRSVLPDYVVADAGSAIELRAPVTALKASSEAAEVRWKQISGTPVDIVDASGLVLRMSMPETFTQEEVVLEVEVTQGGQHIVQEVTVQVQPVGMTN